MFKTMLKQNKIKTNIKIIKNRINFKMIQINNKIIINIKTKYKNKNKKKMKMKKKKNINNQIKIEYFLVEVVDANKMNKITQMNSFNII